MLIEIPPKCVVANVIGCNKANSAINFARRYADRKRNFAGQYSWERGYFALTVGRGEGKIGECIRNHESDDKRIDQLSIL